MGQRKNLEPPQVVELELGERIFAKEIRSTLLECGYSVRLEGQKHDTIRDVELITYTIENLVVLND